MKMNFLGKGFGGTVIAVLCLTGGSSLPIASAQDQSVPVPGDATLPADIQPDSPLAQVVRLAQAGVDESVILAYINNSSSPFNLTSGEIIYLKDLGLPDDAVQAMMQRDQQLGAPATAAPETASDTNAVETSAPPAEVTQNYFYDTLSPYGDWVDIAGYGLCWQPIVVIYDSNWQPYCDHGHWVYTDCGWYWLSDYSWGATTFHYGRWFHDPRHGWCWWPDTVWSPSWVTWRYGNNYCGWAPLPPHTVYRQGVGIFYNGVAVNAGFNFGLSANFFTFVPTQNFCDPHLRRFRVAPAQAAQIYSHTTIINDFNADSHSHTIINAGIPARDISAVTRTEIHPVAIREVSAPIARGEQLGRDNQSLIINRPHFNPDAATTLNNGVRPRVVTVVRPTAPRPIIVNGNGNNFTPRPQMPAENHNQRFIPAEQTQAPHVGAPAQTPAFIYHSAPAQTPNSTYDPDKRIYSPRQQQFEQQSPHAYQRDTGEHSVPAATPEPQQTEHYSPPSSSSSQSFGSQPSNRQGWNQNKPGH